ncbi:MAG: AAA family ATPase [Candidatus Aenigmatarchaeota archaeon]|nr:MAG: AAA family ATPase [Candidatus Aenigmarchaeota archaeon]
MNSGMNFNEKYMNMFSWKENPFSFKILPDLFVGYLKEMEKIYTSIQNKDKFFLLIGPTGSGKTTLMKFLTKKFDKEKMIFYLSKPPDNPDDWVKIFTNFIGFGIFERLFSRKTPDLYSLSEWVNRKIRNRDVVLLVDESHEASIETLEWLRTLTDQIDNLSVVIAGLPILESILRDNLETFTRRVNTRMELANLTKSETRELIKKRIEWAGGEDIKPFTSETIEHVYEKTGGFPREVIRICNGLVQKAIESKISTIDVNFLKDSEFASPKRISLGSMDSLPSKQRNIIEIMGKYGELTPSEIVEKMDLDAYKSRDNAIRSINNILKRLVKEGMLIRKRRGKSYQYVLSDKIRTLMVNA